MENIKVTEVSRFGYENAKPHRLRYERLGRASAYRLICEVQDSEWAAASMVAWVEARTYLGLGTLGEHGYGVQLGLPTGEGGIVQLNGTIYDHFYRFSNFLDMDVPPGGRMGMGYLVPLTDAFETGIVTASTTVNFTAPSPDAERFDLPPREIVWPSQE